VSEIDKLDQCLRSVGATWKRSGERSKQKKMNMLSYRVIFSYISGYEREKDRGRDNGTSDFL